MDNCHSTVHMDSLLSFIVSTNRNESYKSIYQQNQTKRGKKGVLKNNIEAEAVKLTYCSYTFFNRIEMTTLISYKLLREELDQ